MISFEIREIAATETHDLRRRVLRDGAYDAELVWDGDDESTTLHLGVLADDRILTVSTWLVRPDPMALRGTAMQLRGMATDPTATGRGLGRALLEAGTERAAARGHVRVWANARVTALGFYEAAGWTVSGPVFETALPGLPHRHIHRDLV